MARPRVLLLAVCILTHAYSYQPPLRPRPAPHSRRLTRYAAPTRSSDAQKAVSTLAFVTAAWGTQHSVAKAALDSVGDGHALELTAARFVVAALALAQFRPKDEETWRWGAELGVWSFLGFALQTVGLETTTATRSAFLLYLNVKFVPLLELANGKTLPRGTWLSAFAALSGTLLLAADSDTINGSWAPGDTLSVLAALASACFIIRLEPARGRATTPTTATSSCACTTTATSCTRRR